MGTDKALILIDGKTLLERATELCRTFCNQILISSNHSKHVKPGFQVIPDEIQNCGPIGGIYSCIRKSESDWNFVISVDSTGVTPEFIEFLLAEIDNSEAVVPVHENGKEPLIAFYHKNSLPVFQRKIEIRDYKMQNLLDSLQTRFVNVDTWIKNQSEILRNFNRPEDLVF